jgi:hypothetical protein
MNAQTDLQHLPATHSSQTSALVLDPANMKSMMEFADFMAKAGPSIPSHLRGKAADCLAVTMQAMQWGMSPFVIAQKTHVSQSGVLGYEAQLINAVAVSCGALRTQPEFEFVGNWTKILGRVKEMESNKEGEGGKKSKYYVRGWNDSDEAGLGVICTAVLRGETEPRRIEVLLSQCYPRFSTQWATDPQQQITYAAVRKFCRRYAPGSILGVYTPDELEDFEPPARIQPDPRRDIFPEYPEADFQKNLPAYRKAIESGKQTAAQIIGKIGTKYTVTADQQAALAAISPPQQQAAPAEGEAQ